MPYAPYIVSAIAFAYGLWKLLVRPYLTNKKPFRDLPMPDGSHPLFGHLPLLQNKDVDQAQKTIFTSKTDEYGRSGNWLGSSRWLVLTRWEDARLVLNSESTKAVHPRAQKVFGKLMPHTILLQNGKQWKHTRAAINKSFTPAGLHASTDAMVRVTKEVGTSIKERIEKDGKYHGEMEYLMKLITFDIFAASTFSADYGSTRSLKSHEFAAAFEKMATDFQNSKQTLHDYVDSIVEERQREKGAPKKDLLTAIIAAYSKNINESNNDSAEVLRDNVITVLAAGYDTTSITLTYALYLLSQHPEVTEKCLEEIRMVGSLKDFDKLAYCNAVVLETLRMYPPATVVHRCVQKTIKLPGNGYEIPAGTNVIMPVWSIHRDIQNFAFRPLDFLPERWVREENLVGEDGKTKARWVERDPSKEDETLSSVPAANPKALFSFSGGGRNCPGMKFAKQEAVIVLAGLIKDFKFETSQDYILEPSLDSIIQHPKDRMPMTITLRGNE